MSEMNWSIEPGRHNIRSRGGGFTLVLESHTRGAYDIAPMLLAEILTRLNMPLCKCGKTCDQTGYCDDCLGG